jgi:hypothetical protein
MAEFIKISEWPKKINLMREPMEVGLIPDCGDYFLRDFDLVHGNRELGEDDDLTVKADAPLSNADAIEEEIYDRFAWAIRQKFSKEEQEAIPYDESLILLKGQACQRGHTARFLISEYRGLQIDQAMIDLWGRPSDTRKKREERLASLLRNGYSPRRSAAELLAKGTKGLPDPLTGLLPIAKKLTTSSKEADAMKNCVLAPWPPGFFDKGIRIHLYFRTASRAFRRAYDDFFVWPYVATPCPVAASNEKEVQSS